MSDFVDDLRERAITACTALGISREVAALIAAEVVTGLATDWAGERPYIGTREQTRIAQSARDRAIRRDHRNGESVTLIARRYGISRQRVYVIVSEG